MRQDNRVVTAAGIVLFRKINGTCEVLGLVALPSQQQRCTGLYDFPKGQIDSGEDAFDAALRECYEESGLRPDNIVAGPFYDESMVFWLGEVEPDALPVVRTNPKTGLKEHLEFAWVTPDEAVRSCLDYLFQVSYWVKSVLKKNTYIT